MAGAGVRLAQAMRHAGRSVPRRRSIVAAKKKPDSLRPPGSDLDCHRCPRVYRSRGLEACWRLMIRLNLPTNGPSSCRARALLGVNLCGWSNPTSSSSVRLQHSAPQGVISPSLRTMVSCTWAWLDRERARARLTGSPSWPASSGTHNIRAGLFTRSNGSTSSVATARTLRWSSCRLPCAATLSIGAGAAYGAP